MTWNFLGVHGVTSSLRGPHPLIPNESPLVTPWCIDDGCRGYPGDPRLGPAGILLTWGMREEAIPWYIFTWGIVGCWGGRTSFLFITLSVGAPAWRYGGPFHQRMKRGWSQELPLDACDICIQGYNYGLFRFDMLCYFICLFWGLLAQLYQWVV